MATFLRTNSASSLSSIGSDNSDVLGKSLKSTQEQMKNRTIVQRTRDALGDIGNRLKKNPVGFGGKAAPLAKKDAVFGGAGTKEFPAPLNRPPRAVVKPKAKTVEKSTTKLQSSNKLELETQPASLKAPGLVKAVRKEAPKNETAEKVGVTGKEKDNAVALPSTEEGDAEAADKENEYDPKLSDEEQTEAFSSDRLNEVLDIDLDDWNPLLVKVYIQEIYDYLFALEKKYPVRAKYLEGRPINSRMRGVLVDWLVDVHTQFNFVPETLYLTVKVLDRYLQADRSVSRKHLQLVGVTALYIAAKYEEVCTPCVQDFAAVSDDAFTVADVIKMEQSMLTTLSFDMAFPLAVFFLRRFSKSASVCGATMDTHCMAKYIMELSIQDYNACHMLPSERAAGSLGLALIVLEDQKLTDLWTPTIQHYSRFTLEEVKPHIATVAGVLARSFEPTFKLKAIHKKYTIKRLAGASLRLELRANAWKNRITAEVSKNFI